jgi:hypothetical protein
MSGPYVINDLMLLSILKNSDAVIPPVDKPYGVQCVGLIKFFSNAPRTSEWRKGPAVRECYPGLPPGTAIATFIGDIYPSLPHGNHACFFKEFLADNIGFSVLEQHYGPHPKVIQARDVYYDAAGDLALNGSNYSVIL